MLGVVEDPFDPGLAGFGDELDLALVRRRGDVAEPVAAGGARCHLDRGQPLEQVDEADGEPVDLLGRVEAVVVVLDEATEPGPPRELEIGLRRWIDGLQPGFDLAVIRARRVGGVEDAFAVVDLDDGAAGVCLVELELAAPVDRVRLATRLSSSSSRVQVGDQVRAGWLNANRNRPSGMSAGAPASLRPAAVAFRHLLLDPWDKVR